MARTKAENYNNKRDSITQKAAKLFAHKGFSGTSISDISKACDVSKSLIYHYYDAKEDILYGVMKSHIDDLTDAISRPDLSASDAAEEFYNLTCALLDCYAGADDAQKVLLYELNNLTDLQRGEIVAKQRSIIDKFEHVYLRIDPKLTGKSALLRSRIMLFFGSVNWIHTWYNPQGAINLETLAKMAVENTIGKPL